MAGRGKLAREAGESKQESVPDEIEKKAARGGREGRGVDWEMSEEKQNFDVDRTYYVIHATCTRLAQCWTVAVLDCCRAAIRHYLLSHLLGKQMFANCTLFSFMVQGTEYTPDQAHVEFLWLLLQIVGLYQSMIVALVCIFGRRKNVIEEIPEQALLALFHV